MLEITWHIGTGSPCSCPLASKPPVSFVAYSCIRFNVKSNKWNLMEDVSCKKSFHVSRCFLHGDFPCFQTVSAMKKN